MAAEATADRPLTGDEQSRLEQQGCRADDWAQVRVADPFDASRLRDVILQGQVRLGSNCGGVTSPEGRVQAAGIAHARLIDCVVGADCRISRVGVHLANYRLGAGVCVEDVGLLETRPGATFGNGVEVEVLNEGGGREVTLFDDLDAQFAHMLCLYRYRPAAIRQLQQIAREAAGRVAGQPGWIGDGSLVRSVRRMVDVRVGAQARLDGCSCLENGTILSRDEAPTRIGFDVQAQHFIVAEGACVDGGAMLHRTYVGQACQVGRQFSAESSLFFANCEAFHGEACSLLAGPYTVTHHKSTLLIAGCFSFYNAGSGSNQSNHMYKLGPVHEGKLERGCKTGSFSYLMWPCRVGPFSVVLGKHSRTFDTHLFPFSHLQATAEGRCEIVPGIYLMTVGTVRDAAKWPQRDRRRGPCRDRITFDVLSPFTVGRMLRGQERLQALAETTDRRVEVCNLGGAEVKRVLLRTAQKFYRTGTELYLLDKIVARISSRREQGASLRQSVAAAPQAVFSSDWVDVGGLLMPAQRLQLLLDALESGQLRDWPAWHAAVDEVGSHYAEDEWAWVRQMAASELQLPLDDLTPAALAAVGEKLLNLQGKFQRMVENDAAKEFEEAARTGYGQDGQPGDAERDFAEVRGSLQQHSFQRQLAAERDQLAERVARLPKS